MSDHTRHFRGDPSGSAPHGTLSGLCQLALLSQHMQHSEHHRAMVALLGASPHLLRSMRKPSAHTGCLLRQASGAQEGSVGPKHAHGVQARAGDERACASSQVRAHVHEHKYPHTHTALEQMTQRFLWKDVRSI